MKRPVEHPWQLARSIWGKSVLIGTAVYVAIIGIAADFEVALAITGFILLAALSSFPIVFSLRILLPLALRLPHLAQRWMGLTWLIVSHFMLAVVLLAVAMDTADLDIPRPVLVWYKWQNLALIATLISPYLVTTLVVTWRTCWPWLVPNDSTGTAY